MTWSKRNPPYSAIRRPVLTKQQDESGSFSKRTSQLAPDSGMGLGRPLWAGLIAGIVLLLPVKTPDDFVIGGWRCPRTEFILAVPVALFFLARRGAFLTPKSLNGILGGWRQTVLQYTCDLQELGHLLVCLVVSTFSGVLFRDCVGRVGLYSARPLAFVTSGWT